MVKVKGTILIYDDERDVRQLLHQMLEGEGYHCGEAANAREALGYLRDRSVDVVLLNINMPGKFGMELLRQIKEGYPDVLVITVTVISDVNTAIESTRQGAYDYVIKPFNVDEVVNCVERAMEKRRLQLELINYQQQLEEKVEEQAEEIRDTFLGAMSALSFALEAKDSYTAGHSRRVADIAVAIGKKLSLKEDELEDLRWGSLLHDMAKIAVDELILHKNSKLTPKEYEHVMTHPIVGACIAGSIVRRKRIIEVIQYHHAHYDGGGFRQKLRGEDLPLLARIVAVADAYDAMTSTRPYRPALSREKALAIIRAEIHQQFDPLVADTFLKMSETDIMPYRGKVLIADDEESIRLLVKSILGNDYVVIEAADGQEAVEAAQNHKPALILMDILMPEKDGFLACCELKANLTTRAIPVVILTIIDEELDRTFASDVGAAGYITKPFGPRDLLDTVRQFVKGPE